MGKIELPTRDCSKITVVQIPQAIFGKRITIHAHEIKEVQRGRDVCDGHNVAQTHAKGDIKFFSRTVDISNI